MFIIDILSFKLSEIHAFRHDTSYDNKSIYGNYNFDELMLENIFTITYLNV